MISSLGRYGVVERSLLHLASRRSTLVVPLHVHVRHRAVFGARLVSDTSTRTKAEPSAPTPPPTTGPRKAKVDLRPAPVKPPPPSSKPPPLTPSAVQTKSSSPRQEHEKGASELIKTNAEDMREAEAHGVLAPPPATAGRVGRFFHQLKELFKFYYHGMKLVYSQSVRAREMKQRVKNGGEPLSRWESRFVARSRKDVTKLIPFVLIVLVIEEIIPLIVLYAPWMLPSTCVLPSQRERIEKKRREKQETYASTMTPELRAILDADVASLRKLRDGQQLIALCGMLSLSSFGVPSRRARRIERHLQGVVEDDALLKTEGMGTRLTHPELYEALEERGIVSVGLEPRTALARLSWWLREADATTDGDAISRRIRLVARSGLGLF